MIERFTGEFLEAVFNTGAIRNEDVMIVDHGGNEMRFDYPVSYETLHGLIVMAGNETYPTKVKKIAEVCTRYAKDVHNADELLGVCTAILKRPLFETTKHKAAAKAIADEMINPPSKFKSFQEKLAELPKERQERILVAANKMIESIKHFDSLHALKKRTAQRDGVDFEQELGNILARIHKDGGHYIAEHGWEKAMADADIILSELIVSPTESHFNNLSTKEIRILLRGLEIARCQFQEGLEKQGAKRMWWETSTAEIVSAHHALHEKLKDEGALMQCPQCGVTYAPDEPDHVCKNLKVPDAGIYE